MRRKNGKRKGAKTQRGRDLPLAIFVWTPLDMGLLQISKSVETETG